MRKNLPPYRAALAALLLFAATLLAAPAPLDGRGEPPELVAEVVLEPGSQLHGNLEAADRDRVVRDLSRLLARLGQEQFPFLRWVAPADRPAAAAPPAARLTARVVDVAAGAGIENRLRFGGQIAGQELDLPQVREPRVFEWFDLDKHDPVRVERAVADRLEEVFGVDADRRDLHQQFLGSVPLSREVVADEDHRRVIVPVAWEHLRAGPDSVFLVTFRVASDEGAQSGLMRLSSIKERLSDPHPGSVEGVIVLFNFPPTTLTTPGAWDPSVSETMAVADGLSVFMETYVQRLDPGTLGDLVTDPR